MSWLVGLFLALLDLWTVGSFYASSKLFEYGAFACCAVCVQCALICPPKFVCLSSNSMLKCRRRNVNIVCYFLPERLSIKHSLSLTTTWRNVTDDDWIQDLAKQTSQIVFCVPQNVLYITAGSFLSLSLIECSISICFWTEICQLSPNTHWNLVTFAQHDSTYNNALKAQDKAAAIF